MYVNVGIDIGSTTVKIVVVRDGEIIHKHYERHFSKVRLRKKAGKMLLIYYILVRVKCQCG